MSASFPPSDLAALVRVEAQRLSDTFYSDANETALSAISSSLSALQRYRTDCYGEPPDVVALFPLPLRTESEASPAAPSPEVADVIDLDDEEDNAAEDTVALAEALAEASIEAFRFEAREKLITFMFPRIAARNLVVMGTWSSAPEYRGWVHVQKEFYAGEEFPPTAHMPFLGDEERHLSEDIFSKMGALAGDGSTDEDLSDGELDENNDFFVLPVEIVDAEDDNEVSQKTWEAWVLYRSLEESRVRAVRRLVTVEISRLFSLDNLAVVDALVDFFGVRKLSARNPQAHIRKIFELAQERKVTMKADRKKRMVRKYDCASLAEAWERDTGYPNCPGKEWFEDNETAAMRYFCFTCHTFNCRQHSGTGVEPIYPIKDSYVEMRMASLAEVKSSPPMTALGQARRKARGVKLPVVEPCSKNCFLASLPRHHETSAWDGLGEISWTAEQRQLLRLGLLMFKYDPCNVALAVGVKTCRETYFYIESNEMRAEVIDILKEDSSKRWPMERNRARPASSIAPRQRDRKKDRNAGKGRAGTKKRSSGSNAGSRQGTSIKTLASSAKRKGGKPSSEDDRSGQWKDFVPCAHTGGCSENSDCSCFVNSLYCEATCGCNSGRWTSQGLELPGKNSMCSYRFTGCGCDTMSGCNTDRCACWVANRSCDPDFCNSCSASVLPSEIDASDRRCLNVGVIVKHTKVTKVGKSRTHGFGLFCGETLAANDTIGVYGGRILDTSLADTEGFLYKEMDHTFLLGMKTKFANHSSSDGCNATNRMVVFRGIPHIILIAKRNIRVGEEIKFDYGFRDQIPYWAKRDRQPTPESGSD